MARIANKLLRQIKRYFIYEDAAERAHLIAALMRQKPEIFNEYQSIVEGLPGFLSSVEESYNQYEEKNKIAIRNLELSSHELNQVNRKLEFLNISINAMLESLGPGLLFFDHEGLCSPTYSKSCLKYLGSSPGGKYIWDILKFKDSETENFKTLIKFLASHDSAMSFEELMSLAPQMKIQEDGRILKIEYRAMKSQNNTSNAVLVIITDKTDEEENKKLIEEKNKTTNFILRLSKNRNGFQQFINNFYDYFLDAENPGYIFEETLESLQRSVHTFKGLSGIFCVDSLSNTLNEIEDEFISDNLQNAKDSIQKNNPKLMDQYKSIIIEAENLFGAEFIAQGETRAIKKEKLLNFYNLMKEGITNEEITEIFFKEFMAIPVWDVLEPLDYYMQELGGKLGKDIGRTIFSGVNLKLDEEYYKSFFNSLTHVARNIVDHGIEFPEDRKKFKKPHKSKIIFHTEEFEDQGSWFRLIIEDDGAGIDVNKIKKIMIKKDLPIHDLTEKDLLLEILQPNFSTRNQIDNLSGRGVGLNVVYEEIKKRGGRISIDSKLYEGTRFTIELPLVYVK